MQHWKWKPMRAFCVVVNELQLGAADWHTTVVNLGFKNGDGRDPNLLFIVRTGISAAFINTDPPPARRLPHRLIAYFVLFPSISSFYVGQSIMKWCSLIPVVRSGQLEHHHIFHMDSNNNITHSAGRFCNIVWPLLHYCGINTRCKWLFKVMLRNFSTQLINLALP